MGWDPGLNIEKRMSWVPAFISLLPDFRCKVTSCLKSQPPCLLWHDELYSYGPESSLSKLCLVSGVVTSVYSSRVWHMAAKCSFFQVRCLVACPFPTAKGLLTVGGWAEKVSKRQVLEILHPCIRDEDDCELWPGGIRELLSQVFPLMWQLSEWKERVQEAFWTADIHVTCCNHRVPLLTLHLC